MWWHGLWSIFVVGVGGGLTASGHQIVEVADLILVQCPVPDGDCHNLDALHQDEEVEPEAFEFERLRLVDAVPRGRQQTYRKLTGGY